MCAGPSRAQALRFKPHGVSKGGVLWRESHAWEIGSLNASARAEFNRTASCDQRIYADGMGRMRRELRQLERSNALGGPNDCLAAGPPADRR